MNSSLSGGTSCAAATLGFTCPPGLNGSGGGGPKPITTEPVVSLPVSGTSAPSQSTSSNLPIPQVASKNHDLMFIATAVLGTWILMEL